MSDLTNFDPFDVTVVAEVLPSTKVKTRKKRTKRLITLTSPTVIVPISFRRARHNIRVLSAAISLFLVAIVALGFAVEVSHGSATDAKNEARVAAQQRAAYTKTIGGKQAIAAESLVAEVHTVQTYLAGAVDHTAVINAILAALPSGSSVQSFTLDHNAQCPNPDPLATSKVATSACVTLLMKSTSSTASVDMLASVEGLIRSGAPLLGPAFSSVMTSPDGSEQFTFTVSATDHAPKRISDLLTAIKGK